MEIVPSTDYESPRSKTGNFAKRLIERAGPDYYSLERAAEIFGVKKPALRAQITRKDLPYSYLVHGRMEIIVLSELELCIAAYASGEPAVSSTYSHLTQKYKEKKEKLPIELKKALGK